MQYERNDSMMLVRMQDLDRPVILCPEQAAQLFVSLENIDKEANIAWTVVKDVEKREYSHHLGWGIFITVMLYHGKRYYDIRKWWMPKDSAIPKATRTGIRLNEYEMTKFRDSQAMIETAAPEIQQADPCPC